MKIRTNLIIINIFVITLALVFSTLMHLAHLQKEAGQQAYVDQNTAIKTFWQLLLAKGSDFRIVDGQLLAGDYVTNGNYELPDKVKDIFGGTATIFMRDTRVTTNVLKEDGSRAIGTKLTGSAYDAIFKKNSPYRGEAPVLGIPYFTAYDPIRDKSGNIVGVLYVGVKKSDFLATYSKLKFEFITGAAVLEILLITLVWGLLRERNQTENRIRKMADQSRLITDAIPAAIAYIDADLQYQFANRRYLELFGGDTENLIGKDIREVQGGALFSAQEDNIFQVQTGEEFVFLQQITLKNGGTLHLQTAYIPHCEKSGKVIGFFIQHHDITDLVLAKEALQTQLNFLQTLIDNIPSPVFYKDREGRYTGCNISFCNAMGKTREDLIGKTVYDLAPEDLADQYHEMDEALFITPGIQVYDASVVYADGSRHEVTFNKATFSSLDDRVEGLVGVMLDLTERKQAEKWLAGEKSALEMIVQDAPLTNVLELLCKNFEGQFPGALCSIMLLEKDGRRLRTIAAPSLPQEYSRAINGTRIGPLVGSCGTAAFTNQIVVTADIATDPRWEKYRSLPLSFGLQASWSIPIHSSKGDTLGTIAVYHSAPHMPDDMEQLLLEQAAHLASIIIERNRNEVALRESEERFHQIFMQKDDAVLLIRLDNFDIIDANPSAEELFDYSRNELLSMRPYDLIARDDFDSLIVAIPESGPDQVFQLARGEGVRLGGVRITIAIRCNILLLHNEHVMHCSIRDITEKVQLEKNVRTAQAKLIHANKMTSIGMLASSVAHEINNPNNCISVNAAMLSDVWKDAEPLLKIIHAEQGEFMLRGIPFTKMQEFAPRLLDGIREGSRRITAIVQNMRDYVREDKSGLHGIIDINQLLQNAVSILWHHIHIHTDHFTTDMGKDLPPARGNGQQIEQVIINLLTNALQSLADKKYGVCVTTGSGNGENIIITVRDEGMGMDETTLAHLTEPFFTTRTDDGGTGLGLYISSSIIKEHGGTLEFQSEPGLGTIATIRLSVAK